MNNEITLQEMPFYPLFNFQLIDEFETTYIKYSELISKYNFKQFMAQNTSRHTSESVNCYYYDIDSFNSLGLKENKHFSMFHINLQSSFKSYQNLKSYISTFDSSFDLYVISEATNSQIEVCANLLDGYVFDYKPPINCTKGGVGVYYRKELQSHVIERTDLHLNNQLVRGLEEIWMEIKSTFTQF